MAMVIDFLIAAMVGFAAGLVGLAAVGLGAVGLVGLAAAGLVDFAGFMARLAGLAAGFAAALPGCFAAALFAGGLRARAIASDGSTMQR